MRCRGKKILVTGGGGFIGSHLVESLLALGNKVTAFIRYTSRSDPGDLEELKPAARKRVALVFGDLRDPDAVRKAVRGKDLVFHLGALVAIPYSYLHPREVIETNVLGTFNVLTAALEERVERVVHASTSEVYGTAVIIPIDETHPLCAQSPYAASKIGGDKLAESFHRSFGLPVTTIRPFNTYGPRQSARAVIPTIIAQALWRTRIRLGSLEPTRDFTYVSDTARGFILGAESDEAIGRVVQLGTDSEISIGDLCRKILALVGKRAPVVGDARRVRPRESEVMRLRADASAAKRMLRWEPTVRLDDGLRRTIAWIRGHPQRYDPDLYAI